jgi:hypothetical protein
LHSEGLNIVGVSLDKDAAKWKSHRKDKLTWTHVSNLKFWDEPIAAIYESKQFHLLLDASGKIVAKRFKR